MAKTVALAGVAALAVALSACGSHGASPPQAARAPSTPGTSSSAAAPEVNPQGDIPDNQQYVTYAGPGYTVKVPEGWARTTAGGATTFTDKLNSIVVGKPNTAAKRPTAASATATEIPQLARTVKGFANARAGTVTRTAGPAVRITYVAASAPDAVTGKTRRNAVERYEFFHSGKLVVLTLSGPKGADNVDPWKIVTDSLRWTR
jgi:hypothetical protein